MPLKDILHEHERRLGPSETKSSVSVGGDTYDLDESQTVQQVEDSILGAQKHGVPRGKEAYQARELGETWAMEIIKNAINDQLSGAELGMETPEDNDPSAEAQTLWSLFRDILQGPHYQDDDWNDIVSAAVSDLCDVGHGYWEPVGTSDGSVPVGALKPVDALTVRHNVNEKGAYGEPAFYQAPFKTHGGSIVSAGSSEITELNREDLIVMRYPGSNRSDRVYPRAPGMQVQAALEHLTHSTIHSTRYYNENEIPAGFLQLMNANDQAISNVQESIKNSVGDPRSVEVIGGEGPANWVEMGGTALNLDVLEEQRWFLQLCLAAFGLNKQEIGLIDDVNRAEGDNQLSIVHKRVTQGFLDLFEEAITRQVFPKFESYNALPDDQRFWLKLSHSDPRQERAREEHLRERYEAGALSLNEYYQRLGEVADDSTVTIAGQEIDYGNYPKHIVEALIREALGEPASGPPGGSDGGGDGDEDGGDNE